MPWLLVACTAFLLQGPKGPLVAKSYDWEMGQGSVLLNRSGVQKTALQMDRRETPAKWTSQHASLTFNQYGRELPNGGLNDAGLVVEVLWLDSTELPPHDARPSVNELEWVQYQLDSFATVEEMRRNVNAVRISLVHGKVHYFACDRSGACAAFESINGRMQVSNGARALANNTYPDSSSWAARQRSDPQGSSSRARFTRAMRASAAGGDVERAFSILDGVRWDETQWNIVYDPVSLQAHYRTRASSAIKTVTLAKASCSAPVVGVDIDANAQLSPFTAERNRSLVKRSLADLVDQLPPGTIDLVATHPDAMRCTQP